MFYWLIKIITWPFVWLAFLCPTIRNVWKNLPKKGGAIVICNHTTIFDPVLMIWLLPRTIHFLAKSSLFNTKLKKWFFKGLKAIPVNRNGNDVASVVECIDILKLGGLIGIYPEGTRSKTGRMLPFEKGVAFIALRSKMPVIPVGTTKRYKIFQRPKIIMGEPMTFPQYYDKRMSADAIRDVTKTLEDAVKKLADQANG